MVNAHLIGTVITPTCGLEQHEWRQGTCNEQMGCAGHLLTLGDYRCRYLASHCNIAYYTARDLIPVIHTNTHKEQLQAVSLQTRFETLGSINDKYLWIN